MATRALQDPLQLLGFRDPITDEWLAGGSVEFFSAGTSNLKEAWEDKDKITAITSVTLDSSGQAQVYFDGIYKFVVKNSSGTVQYTLDNLKYRASATTVLTKTTDYTATVDDDVILCDTTAGTFTITLYPAADAVESITIKNIGGAGNAVTVAADGAELINGSSGDVTLVDGAAQEYYSDLTQWFGAATTTGTTYTTSNLIAGANVTFTAGGGQTSVSVNTSSEIVKGVIERSTDAEAITGTATDLALTPANLAAVIGGSKYLSIGQTITSAGQLVLPHGLSSEPTTVQYILQCTTIDAGYAVGDRIIVDQINGNNGSANTPLIDNTNITIRFSSAANSFSAANKGTGGSTSLTNSSWQLYVTARA